MIEKTSPSRSIGAACCISEPELVWCAERCGCPPDHPDGPHWDLDYPDTWLPYDAPQAVGA